LRRPGTVRGDRPFRAGPARASFAVVPAPIAPLVGFLLGMALAWTAAGDPSRASTTAPPGRALVIVTLYSFLVFAPASGYFLAFAPDWSYAYAVDSSRLSSAVDLAVVLLNVGSVPAGFTLAFRRIRERGPGQLLRLASPPLLAAVVFLVVALPRLSVHATYAQFHGDFGVRSVAGSPLGYALLWMDAILALGAVFTGRALRQLSAPKPGR
jgi:hypothetical protein